MVTFIHDDEETEANEDYDEEDCEQIDSSTTTWFQVPRWRPPDFPLCCLTLGHASAAAKLNKKKRN